MIVVSFILAFAAIAALVCSFYLCPEWSTRLSSASTIMSIVLGIMSIVYSYRCNKSTDALLEKIEEEFEKVSEYAMNGTVHANVNKANLDSVTQMLKERDESTNPAEKK